LVREKKQSEIATKAEQEMRKASSDTALLAAVRTMNARQLKEARSLLEEALERWPENEAARFSLNYLDAILPEPRLLESRELPIVVEMAEAHPDGGFLLRSSDEQLYHLTAKGELKKESKEPAAPKVMAVHPFTVIQEADVVEFRDVDSQDLILAPLIFNNRAKLATYSYEDRLLLVHDGSSKIELWEAGDHLTGFREAIVEDEIKWLEFSRTNSNLWLGSSTGKLIKWHEGEDPEYVAQNRAMLEPMDPWKIGEGHDRGLPEDFSAFVVFLQVNAWQLGGKRLKHHLG
jgi:hypothetical protein